MRKALVTLKAIKKYELIRNAHAKTKDINELIKVATKGPRPKKISKELLDHVQRTLRHYSYYFSHPNSCLLISLTLYGLSPDRAVLKFGTSAQKLEEAHAWVELDGNQFTIDQELPDVTLAEYPRSTDKSL